MLRPLIKPVRNQFHGRPVSCCRLHRPQARFHPRRSSYLQSPVTPRSQIFVAKEQGTLCPGGLDVSSSRVPELSRQPLGPSAPAKLDIGAFGTTAPLVHISGSRFAALSGGIMGRRRSSLRRRTRRR
jgi:hypothetical protein